MIQLTYAPEGAAAHVVLAGKGITFDSGGLSLKPNDGMKLMKTDMAGGAAVIAVMSALGALGVRARVDWADRRGGKHAVRIGDAAGRHHHRLGGRTVEVLNTDAEGRLVLADLLAYAEAALDPGVIVDLATLTGAARIALGHPPAPSTPAKTSWPRRSPRPGRPPGSRCGGCRCPPTTPGRSPRPPLTSRTSRAP